jgi:hypothetical protein
MASVPSGLSSLPSGLSNYGYSQSGTSVKVPPGGYGTLPAALGTTSTSKSTSKPGTTQSGYGPFDVTPPTAQTFGIGSAFNPMTVFDLMNQGASPFVSPFAGSGLLGYPSSVFGGGVVPMSAGAGNMAAGAAVPGSGGKGIAL